MEKQKAKPETHTGRIARTSKYGFQLEQHVATEIIRMRKFTMLVQELWVDRKNITECKIIILD